MIPKVHCQDFLGLPKEYLGGVLEAAQTVARATVRALSLEGFNVFCNNGPVAGQSVFHFHMHVTPRYRNDRIRFELTLKHYQDGEMRTMDQNIRTHLSEHSHRRPPHHTGFQQYVGLHGGVATGVENFTSNYINNRAQFFSLDFKFTQRQQSSQRAVP